MNEKPPVKKQESLKLPSLLPFFDKTKEFLDKKVGMGEMVKKIKEVTGEIGTTIKSGFKLFEKIATPAFLATAGSLIAATTFWPLAFMASPFFVVPTAVAAGLYGGGAFDAPGKPADKPSVPAASAPIKK
jgi:hypothetical protein